MNVREDCKLDNERHEELEKALIDAFPNIIELKRLARSALNEDLNAISNDTKTIREIVYDLLQRAKSHGQMELLVKHAYKKNSGNASLRSFVKSNCPHLIGLDSETPFTPDLAQTVSGNWFHISLLDSLLISIVSLATGWIALILFGDHLVSGTILGVVFSLAMWRFVLRPLPELASWLFASVSMVTSMILALGVITAMARFPEWLQGLVALAVMIAVLYIVSRQWVHSSRRNRA